MPYMIKKTQCIQQITRPRITKKTQAGAQHLHIDCSLLLFHHQAESHNLHNNTLMLWIKKCSVFCRLSVILEMFSDWSSTCWHKNHSKWADMCSDGVWQTNSLVCHQLYNHSSMIVQDCCKAVRWTGEVMG